MSAGSFFLPTTPATKAGSSRKIRMPLWSCIGWKWSARSGSKERLKKLHTRNQRNIFICGRSARSLAHMKIFRSEEHTSELQSRGHLVCRLLLEKKNKRKHRYPYDRSYRYARPL